MRLARKNHIAILTAKTDGPFAFSIDEGDDLFVDGTGENHLHHFNRLFVGNAKAAFKARFNAELGQHRLNLRATAMDNNWIDT